MIKLSDRPPWLKVKAPSPAEAAGMRAVRATLSRYDLTTVCQGARCPNAAECWGARTATFMLLGKICTRACRFCAVRTSDPGGIVDQEEPVRLAEAVAELSLSHVVLTSVDRDDLADSGAALFAAAIAKIKERSPDVRVEVLVPDFSGREESLREIVSAGPDVIGHNLETVRRLSPSLRDQRADYDLSLAVLASFKKLAPRTLIKSSLILGLGETKEEIIISMEDLRRAGVDGLTLGQYLRPTCHSTPVVRYIPQCEFDELAAEAKKLGFRSVVSAPLARSSYHAARTFSECSV